MRNVGLILAAAISLTACASTEPLVTGVPNEESPAVDESSATTTAPASSTAAPETTTATTAAVTDTQDDGESAPLATELDVEDREHLTRPWFPNVEGPVEHIDFFNPPAFFSAGPDGELDCQALPSYRVIDEALTFRRDVSWTDMGWSQSSGYVPEAVSTVDLIDDVIASGPCFDAALISSGEVSTGSTSRGPVIDGIASSAVMQFREGELEVQIVLATTGGRDIHIVATYSLAEASTDDGASDATLVDTLEGLGSRSVDAAERVAFCAETLRDQQAFTSITDQRCDGFEEYSPELRLARYNDITTSAANDVVVSPATTTTTTTLPPEQATEELIEESGITPAWTLLINATDIRPGEPAAILPVNAPATTMCEAELGEKARVGNQFDQWFQVETRIEDAAASEQIFHVIGEAPNATSAEAAVNALAAYDSCDELAEILGGPVVSTTIDALPPGVLAGAMWEVDIPGQPTIVGDFALADGTVMAISVSSPTVTPGRILELLDLSLSAK